MPTPSTGSEVHGVTPGDGALLVQATQDLSVVPRAQAWQIWSTSSGLTCSVERNGQQVHNPECLVAPGDYARLTRRILDLRTDIRAALRGLEQTQPCFDDVARAVMAQVYSVMVLFAARAQVLSCWLRANRAHPKLIVGPSELEPPAGLAPGVGGRDNLYAAIAAQLSPAPDLVVHDTPRTSQCEVAREGEYVPLVEKALNIINRPLSAICYRLWRRLGQPGRSGTDKILLLGIENELLEEAFLPLLRAGWRVVPVGVPRMAPEPDPRWRESVLPVVDSLLHAWADAVTVFANADVVSAAGALMRERLEHTLSVFPECRRRAHTWVDNTLMQHAGVAPGESCQSIVYLSSGLYAPDAKLMDAAFGARGVPVVCTDHGAGLGVNGRADFICSDYIDFGDRYVAFTEASVATFKDRVSGLAHQFHVAGVPSVIRRCRALPVVRTAMRMRFGVRPEDKVLMYVASLEQNNRVQGAGMGLDREYLEFQAELLRTLRGWPGTTLLKPYPAQRYADPGQIWQVEQDRSFRIAPFGEFRHHRWAADMLVLDLCSSTLSWALGTDLPLIYINAPADPMTDRAADVARRALFFVDATQADWQAELHALLLLDEAQRNHLWRGKAQARAEFATHFLLGPANHLPSDAVVEAVAMAHQHGPASGRGLIENPA